MAIGKLGVSFDGGKGLIPTAWSWSGFTNIAVLVANVEQTFTAPANATVVLFNSTGNFFAKLNATAAVPGASVTDGTGSELNPAAKPVVPGQTISVVSSAANIVTLSFFTG